MGYIMQLQSATIASDWNKALSEALQQQLQLEVRQRDFSKMELYFAVTYCLKVVFPKHIVCFTDVTKTLKSHIKLCIGMFSIGW